MPANAGILITATSFCVAVRYQILTEYWIIRFRG
jgi:hypothetical protein